MVVFLPLENSDHVFAWVFIDFSLNLLGKEFVTQILIAHQLIVAIFVII